MICDLYIRSAAISIRLIVIISLSACMCVMVCVCARNYVRAFATESSKKHRKRAEISCNFHTPHIYECAVFRVRVCDVCEGYEGCEIVYVCQGDCVRGIGHARGEKRNEWMKE